MKCRSIYALCVIILTVCVLTACHKDKFQTKPTITIKEINDPEVPLGGTLRITLECTDKEGDEGNGILTYIRVRTNSKPIPDPDNNNKADTAVAPVPDFPSKDKVEMTLDIPYSFLDEDPGDNDTMYFRLTLRDRGNNQSDTILTPQIVAKQF
ncbi:MAG TPA: hypothetical protein VGQ53_08505 [Chitinophagaceae bacterium]|jgi:hypothetical protein|nr:hypothetical protein [Chitinophagaceae bacterium]